MYKNKLSKKSNKHKIISDGSYSTVYEEECTIMMMILMEYIRMSLISKLTAHDQI